MSISKEIKNITEKLPQGVSLVAVSKYHTSDSILEAYNVGQRIFGESRPQELQEKVKELPNDIKWHFIGHLQTNKLKMVLPYAELIHSVDSLRLLDAIVKWANNNEKKISILLQLHIAEESTKQGFSKDDLYELLEDIKSDKNKYANIRFNGLMAMASHSNDTNKISNEFKEVKEIFNNIQNKYIQELPDFKELSIGMSDDYTIALNYGATLIRLGSCIFGKRK